MQVRSTKETIGVNASLDPMVQEAHYSVDVLSVTVLPVQEGNGRPGS